MRVVGSARVRSERVMFGSHVVDRFRERVSPDLDFARARAKLAELLPDAQLRHKQPAGIYTRGLRDQILTVAWVTFEHRGKDVVIPLMPWPTGLLGVTCLIAKEAAHATA